MAERYGVHFDERARAWSVNHPAIGVVLLHNNETAAHAICDVLNNPEGSGADPRVRVAELEGDLARITAAVIAVLRHNEASECPFCGIDATHSTWR